MACYVDGGHSGITMAETPEQLDVMFPVPASCAILPFVPSHSKIQAHSNHDDHRVASGIFGYGDHFNADSLKTLPPGRVYSQPGGVKHYRSLRLASMRRWSRSQAMARQTRICCDNNEPRSRKKN